MKEMYAQLGISSEVYDFGHKIEESLKERFEKFDKTAEYNQMKVLLAMQKNKVSAECFGSSSGYGYDDIGRETLEKVYADTFHTEACLVRPQVTCGTHALAIALFGNLRPGDELLAPAGKPYDTLEEVPMWPFTLSGRLWIVALVGRYHTNQLIQRGSILYHRSFSH